MSIDFSSLDFSAEAIKKMQEQAKKEVEEESIELAKKKARCLDSLLIYLNDLQRIRLKYMTPCVYSNDMSSSRDAIILDSMISIMKSAKIIGGSTLIEPTGSEGMMREILGEEDESMGI